MITILAFDPGEVTGFCEMSLDFEAGKATYHTDNLLTLVDVWNRLRPMTGDELRLAIHNESFHLYPHRAAAKIGSSFYEIEVIGVIRLFTQLNVVEHFERPAAMVKSMSIPPQFIMKGHSLHEKDALKHALLCARTCLKVRIDRLTFSKI